ncbi:MAG: hypothetical protein V1837_04400 [Candidatus Woesearchaeota archaeon]
MKKAKKEEKKKVPSKMDIQKEDALFVSQARKLRRLLSPIPKTKARKS